MMSRLMQNLDQFSNLYGQGQLKKKKNKQMWYLFKKK